MKPGVRALGIAESYRNEQSTLCGAVVTTEGTVDGFAFASCTVGGLDATAAVLELWRDAGRPDVRFLLLSGVALAWYNLLDLDRLAAQVSVPIFALTYEASDGLATDIRAQFSGEAAEARLKRYRALPERTPLEVDDETIYVRSRNAADVDPATVLQTFTRAGGRPEPVRVARLAARAADQWHRERLEDE